MPGVIVFAIGFDQVIADMLKGQSEPSILHRNKKSLMLFCKPVQLGQLRKVQCRRQCLEDIELLLQGQLNKLHALMGGLADTAGAQ